MSGNTKVKDLQKEIRDLELQVDSICANMDIPINQVQLSTNNKLTSTLKNSLKGNLSDDVYNFPSDDESLPPLIIDNVTDSEENGILTDCSDKGLEYNNLSPVVDMSTKRNDNSVHIGDELDWVESQSSKSKSG